VSSSVGIRSVCLPLLPCSDIPSGPENSFGPQEERLSGRFKAEERRNSGAIASDDNVEAAESRPLGACGLLSIKGMVLAAEDAVEREKLLQQLPSVLEQLTKPKRQLIHTLYFENVSLRKYAARTGVRHRAIQKRRDHILSKLRIYFLF